MIMNKLILWNLGTEADRHAYYAYTQNASACDCEWSSGFETGAVRCF
jgi:hypothetical protein